MKTHFIKPISILAFLLLFNSCQFSRFVVYNFADIKDYKRFPSRPLHSDSVNFHFNIAPNGKFPKTIAIGDNKAMPFEEYLKKDKAVAFLIIKDDTIQYEKYFRGYEQSSTVTSFSIAKSILSILIGCAIEDGLIRSVDEPVTNYINEFRNKGMEKITIRHLLQMTSGMSFNENYFNPLSDVANFYYGRHLRKNVYKIKPEREPGTQFKYRSGNAQVLGIVLEKALKTKTVTQYLQEKIWQPLGMEYDASWSIDKRKNGMEKTFCCINARARDYARIGRLYLKNGNWNGKQVVPEKWVKESITPDTADGGSENYKYQWWIPAKDGAFLAQGLLGQFIYVNPVKKLIIVKLGKKDTRTGWWEIFTSLAAAY